MTHLGKNIIKYLEYKNTNNICYLIFNKDPDYDCSSDFYNCYEAKMVFRTEENAERFIIHDWIHNELRINHYIIGLSGTYEETYEPLNKLHNKITQYIESFNDIEVYEVKAFTPNQVKLMYEILNDALELAPWIKELGIRCNGELCGPELGGHNGIPLHRQVVSGFDIQDPRQSLIIEEANLL